MSHLMCCFGYASNCGCRNFLIDKYAFYPPKKSYKFIKIKPEEEEEEEELKENQRIKQNYLIQILDSKKQNFESYLYDPSEVELFPDKISNEQGFDIAILLIQYKFLEKNYNQQQEQQINFLSKQQNTNQEQLNQEQEQEEKQQSMQINENNNYVIIYSHGNATDIGQNLDTLIELSVQTQVDILVYDYSGYGESTGTPSDITIIKDITSVYRYAVSVLGYTWNKIILYGQSLGSGPSIYLASRLEFPILGVIIHSGYSSGLRITLNEQEIGKTHKKDFFPNIDLISYINAPVFIIHGTSDKIIPFAHAKDLYSKTKQQYQPWFVQNASHNNIECSNKFKGDYYTQVKKFIKTQINIDFSNNTKQLLKQFRASQWSEEFDHFYKYLNPPLQYKESMSSILELGTSNPYESGYSNSVATTNKNNNSIKRYKSNKDTSESIKLINRNYYNNLRSNDQQITSNMESSEQYQSLNDSFKIKEIRFSKTSLTDPYIRETSNENSSINLNRQSKMDNSNSDPMGPSNLGLSNNTNSVYTNNKEDQQNSNIENKSNEDQK